MSKAIINEEQLQNIIQESIREVLNEWEWLDKIANKIGGAYGGMWNGINNAKNSFYAARDFKRAENKNTDPYAKYYNSANTFTFRGKKVNGSKEFGDMVRAQGGRRNTYRDDRKEFFGRKYHNARQNYMNSDEFIGFRDRNNANANNLAPNPDMTQNTQQNNNKKKRKKKNNRGNGQQGGQQQPPIQPQGGQTNP